MYEKITDVLPKELLQNCISIISLTHKKIGFRELPNLLVQKRNMVILALISEARIPMDSIKGISKIRKVLSVMIALSVIGSFFINLWLLLIPIPLLIIIKQISFMEKKHWFFMASIILGLEMLSVDYLGWGNFYPNFMERAKELIMKNSNENVTQLLDYYLPNRDSVDNQLLNKLGPS